MIGPAPKLVALLMGCLAVLLAACQDEVAIGKIDLADVYVQGGGDVVVDVLWVIDNSGTMSEEQETLEASLGPFVEALIDSRVDFRLAVVSTDTDDMQAGVFQGESAVLTRDTNNLEEQFIVNAAVGFEGSRVEKGFSAVQMALTEPLLSGANTDFLRDEAELAVIFISDEDDQSELSVQDFILFLSELKVGQSVTVSGVVGDVPFGCASLSGAADPANKYLQLVEETDGISYSICASSYAPMMTRLVQRLSNIRDTFSLTRIPDPSSIQVEVDGVIIRERDVDGWAYLFDVNAIFIQGTPLPTTDQEVRITYDNLRF